MVMTPEVWIPIGISCVMMVIAIVTLLRAGKKDTTETAEERASMTADIKYIRGSIDEMKIDNKVMQRDIGDMKIKMTEIEQSVKHAHQRIDTVERGKA